MEINYEGHWDEDHTRYTDELGHTYPRTGEAWSDDDRDAYRWAAFVRMVRGNGRDELGDLLDSARELENDGDEDGGERLRSLACELGWALNEGRYEDAAHIYDRASSETDDDWDFEGGWRQTNADGQLTMLDEEQVALGARVPAINTDGTVYALAGAVDEYGNCVDDED